MGSSSEAIDKKKFKKKDREEIHKGQHLEKEERRGNSAHENSKG